MHTCIYIKASNLIPLVVHFVFLQLGGLPALGLLGHLCCYRCHLLLMLPPLLPHLCSRCRFLE